VITVEPTRAMCEACDDQHSTDDNILIAVERFHGGAALALCPEHLADLHRLTAPACPYPCTPEAPKFSCPVHGARRMSGPLAMIAEAVGRKPCGAWRKIGARRWRLVLSPHAEVFAWQPGARWTWEIRLGSATCHGVALSAPEPLDGEDEAMLAAEDAADALLVEARARLGRG
jgi:hypothetical protein